MKILKITYCDLLHHKKIKDNISNIKEKTYEDIINIYLKDNLIFNRSFSNLLKDNGIDTFHYVYNDNLSQNILFKAIKNRNNSFSNTLKFKDKCLYSYIDAIKPDIVFILGGAYYKIDKVFLYSLKQEFNFKVFVWWGDEILGDIPTFFKNVDEIFVSNHLYQEKFFKKKINSTIMHYPFEKLMEINPTEEKLNKIIFAGSTGFRDLQHFSRFNFLKKIINDIDIDVYTKEVNSFDKYKFFYNLPISFKKIAYSIFNKGKNLLTNNEDLDWIYKTKPLSHSFSNKIFDPVYGIEYQKTLCKYLMNLNFYRDELEDIFNIRFIESISLGVCIFTNKKNLHRNYFDPENDFAGFDTESEFKEKYKFLRNNLKKTQEMINNCKSKSSFFEPKKIIQSFNEVLKKYM